MVEGSGRAARNRCWISNTGCQAENLRDGVNLGISNYSQRLADDAVQPHLDPPVSFRQPFVEGISREVDLVLKVVRIEAVEPPLGGFRLRIHEESDRERLGTTDDCGFSPFADDVSTARDTAFEKIRARVGIYGEWPN
jgi:hypothetical protein